ncbi:MAG TPA: Rnf-Nqr domain containing protein [bacterium]
MKYAWFIIIGSVFVNNLILVRFLGICTLFCPGAKLKEFLKISITLMAVMIASSWLGWIAYYGILKPLNLIFLKLPVFVLLTAVLVQAAVFFFRKKMPGLHVLLGGYLLLFTAHCAVLGIILLAIEQNLDFLQTTAFTLGSGLGGLLVMLVFSAIRESVKFAPVPRAFKGYAIDFVALSLMSLAFLGFIGFLGIF